MQTQHQFENMTPNDQIIALNPSKPILFAAMGTLKRNGSNFRLLKTATFIGVGSTLPAYAMKSLGGFPSLIKGEDKVNVEVFAIDQLTFKRLDSLEGYRSNDPLSSFFTREEIDIQLDSGEKVVAWIYYVAQPKSIESSPDYCHKDEQGRLDWYRSH